MEPCNSRGHHPLADASFEHLRVPQIIEALVMCHMKGPPHFSRKSIIMHPLHRIHTFVGHRTLPRSWWNAGRTPAARLPPSARSSLRAASRGTVASAVTAHPVDLPLAAGFTRGYSKACFANTGRDSKRLLEVGTSPRSPIGPRLVPTMLPPENCSRPSVPRAPPGRM